jgi:hypothetical protein
VRHLRFTVAASSAPIGQKWKISHGCVERR